VMSVVAADPQMVVKVLEATIPYMYELNSDTAENSGGAEREMRLLIHQSIVGGIIGKSGQRIKEIRENSGAAVKVYSTCAPQSSDRCVQVNGVLEKVVAALQEIFEVVANTEVKGYDNHYDPNNFDAFYAHDYGGYGSSGDADRGQGRARGGYSGGRGGFDGGRGGFGGRGGGYGGDYGGGFGQGGGGGFGDHSMGQFGGGFDRGVRGGRGGFGGDMGSFGGDRGFGGGFGGRGGRGGGGQGFGRQRQSMDSDAFGGASGSLNFDQSEEDQGPTETTQVTIPNELAGAIIGPGGQRIRKIRLESKASITIDEPASGSNERVISIVGSPKQIQTAQYLLQQSVREHGSGAGGRGGRGGF